MEQDLRIDPETGFAFSDRRSADAKQNKNYTRHTDPADTARDYSRPSTIPIEEYEAVTGEKHPDTLAKEDAQNASMTASEKAASETA